MNSTWLKQGRMGIVLTGRLGFGDLGVIGWGPWR
jgi:hypothetical protein